MLFAPCHECGRTPTNSVADPVPGPYVFGDPDPDPVVLGTSGLTEFFFAVLKNTVHGLKRYGFCFFTHPGSWGQKGTGSRIRIRIRNTAIVCYCLPYRIQPIVVDIQNVFILKVFARLALNVVYRAPA